MENIQHIEWKNQQTTSSNRRNIIPCKEIVVKESNAGIKTRRPASADRTARRQFQATGQPVSRTQASDAMSSRLPRYEAKCATQVLPMGVGPFAFRYQGNGATPCQYIDTTRKAIDCGTI